MPTNHPIFVMIRFIKTPLHDEKLRTGVTPLRSYRNFIVGLTDPNYLLRSTLLRILQMIINHKGVSGRKLLGGKN